MFISEYYVFSPYAEILVTYYVVLCFSFEDVINRREKENCFFMKSKRKMGVEDEDIVHR